MKKKLKYLILTASLMSLGLSNCIAQDIKRDSLVAREKLQTDSMLYWRGERIYRDSLVYAQWAPDSLRLKRVTGDSWSQWISLAGIRDTLLNIGDSETVLHWSDTLDQIVTAYWLQSVVEIIQVTTDGMMIDIALNRDSIDYLQDSIDVHRLEIESLRDSVIVNIDSIWNHDNRLDALEDYDFTDLTDPMFFKDEGDWINPYFPLGISSLIFPPDGFYTPMNVDVTYRSAYGNTVGYQFSIDGDPMIRIYKVADGAGGTITKRVEIDSLYVDGDKIATKADQKYFKKEITSNGENNITVDFTLLSTAKVFYNGNRIPAFRWTGIETTTITLLFDTRIYDLLIIDN